MNVDDGLENIRWIRGLGGERLPAASYPILNLKKGLFFAIGGRSRNSVVCFLHSSSQVFLYQTPGRRPPPITGRFVNTVTRGWSEPLTSAPSSDFMAQSLVLSIDVCPGLGIPPLQTNIWLSFSKAHLGPRSAQESFVSGFLKKLETFFSKICAHSERYRNLLAGIFEILTFYGNIAFPLSPVLDKVIKIKKSSPSKGWG